jgi:hypothetical protein
MDVREHGSHGKAMTTILGLSVQTAAYIGRIALTAGFVSGIATIIATSFSAYILDRVSSEVQKNADERIAEWTNKTEEAKAVAATANLKAEELHKQNLDLQTAINPRRLEQALTSQRLKPFADVSFIVESINDQEPRETAGQIRWMLLEAGWKKYMGPVNLRLQFLDGVTVRSWLPPEGERGSDAKEALVSILNENGIKADTGAPVKELGPNVVLVIVGSKPLPKSLDTTPSNLPTNDRGFQEWGNVAAPW